MIVAEKIMRLFAGLDRAYGTYEVTKTEGTKKAGKGRTIYGAVTPALWRDHLLGKSRLGIVPIKDNAHISFACIDIDKYDLDLVELEKKVVELRLPLLVTRSKSGGAHLYLFLREETPANVIRGMMAQWAIRLGHPGVEVFPKQDALASDSDVGNWLNMPYFNAEKTSSYGIHEGQMLSLSEYLALAERSSKTLSEIEEAFIPIEEPEGLEEGPPCLQLLAEQGVPEGSRNDALFNFGVYARLRYGDDWEHWTDIYNNQFMDPPLGSAETRVIIKSLSRKTYFYTCSRPCLANICSKSICHTRAYGIGSGDDLGMVVNDVTKIQSDPPIYILGLPQARVIMEVDDITSQARFLKRLFTVTNVLLTPMPGNQFRAFVNKLMQEATMVEAPEDSGVDGMFKYHLQQFCTSKAKANTRDEIALGRPWDSEGRTYFRSGDIARYLEQQRFRGMRQHQIWAALRALGADHTAFSIKGSHHKVWHLPSFEEQTEEFDLPAGINQEF